MLDVLVLVVAWIAVAVGLLLAACVVGVLAGLAVASVLPVFGRWS
jgi:hypothetical protein